MCESHLLYQNICFGNIWNTFLLFVDKCPLFRVMSRYGAFCFFVPMCLSMGFFGASPSLLMCPSTFHRYCDRRIYWEVIFTHSYSPDHTREFREFGNSGNCPAKRLCCKTKSLPWAWELLGSDIYSFVLTRSHPGIPGIREFWELSCETSLV